MLYRLTTSPQKTMFGKLTGAYVARLESDYSSNVVSAAGPTVTKAKEALIDHLGRIASNDQRAYVFCGDAQTILIVSFAGDAWQYDIISTDRTTRSGCIMPGVTDFREAKERAFSHAHESYGGIVRVL